MFPKSLSSRSGKIALSGMVLVIIGAVCRLIPFPFANQVGWLIAFVGGAVSSYATMSFARQKGRTPYLGLLGFIGFVIALVLEPKTAASGKQEKFTLFEGLLTICLTLSLLAFNNIFIFSLAEAPNAFARSLFINQFILAPILALICIIIALLFNKRRVATASAFICTGFLFWLLFSTGNSDLQLKLYVQARNVSYFYLVLYAILHTVVISLAKIKNRSIRIFTPEGIFSLGILLQLLNYLYALLPR